MIPEIWSCILNNIVDVKDICNCRLVSRDFKALISRNTEQIKSKESNENKNIKLSFIAIFPYLKYVYIPTKISNIFLLQYLKVITFYCKQSDLTQYISSLEDFLFPLSPHYICEKKLIKIYTEKSIYWLSQYKYGRYAEHDYDEMDEYLRDATRCKTFISNKKPFQYFPIRDFVYVSPIEELSGFDYYPSNTLRKYTWQPVAGEQKGHKEIYYYKYLEYLADSVLEIDRNECMETYEMPIFQSDLQIVKDALPNLKHFCILNSDSLLYSDRTVYFSHLPDAESFIDNLFKF